jgi:hypothetical protein
MKVHLYFWDIPKVKVPQAILWMATNHFNLKANKSISFYKLLGTGSGETFTPSDANLLRWGLLLVSEDNLATSKVVRKWRAIATHEMYFALAPLSSHGNWSGRNPFAVTPQINKNSEIAVITRARIKFKLSRIFWRSVPPVIFSLRNSPGLKFALGIGEAPIGLQGTFSIWESLESINNFAYKGEAHARVIKQTRNLDWYSEELFARFEVLTKAE